MLKKLIVIVSLISFSFILMTACGGGSDRGDARGGDGSAGGDSASGAVNVQKKFNIDGSGSNTLEAMKDGYEKAIKKALTEILGSAKFNQHQDALAGKFWKPSSIKAKKYFVKRKVAKKENSGKKVTLLIILDIATINKALSELSLATVEPGKIDEATAATPEEAAKKVIEESMDIEEVKKALSKKTFACWFKASDKFNDNQGNIAVQQVNSSLLNLGVRMKDSTALEDQAKRSLAASDLASGGIEEIQEIFNKLNVNMYIHVYGDFTVTERAEVGWFEAKGNIGYKVYDPSNSELWADENGFFRAAAEKEADAITRVIVEVHKNLFPKVLEKAARKAQDPEEYSIQVENVDPEDETLLELEKALKKDPEMVDSNKTVLGESVKFTIMYRGTLDDIIDGLLDASKENEYLEDLVLKAAAGKELVFSVE